MHLLCISGRSLHLCMGGRLGWSFWTARHAWVWVVYKCVKIPPLPRKSEFCSFAFGCLCLACYFQLQYQVGKNCFGNQRKSERSSPSNQQTMSAGTTPPAYPEEKKIQNNGNLESGLESDNDSSINTLHALIAEGKIPGMRYLEGACLVGGRLITDFRRSST